MRFQHKDANCGNYKIVKNREQQFLVFLVIFTYANIDCAYIQIQPKMATRIFYGKKNQPTIYSHHLLPHWSSLNICMGGYIASIGFPRGPKNIWAKDTSLS